MTSTIFYLSTPLPKPEYLRISLKYIPPEVIKQYDLLPLAIEGYVYVEVVKGMYGLKQAGGLANQQLEQHLHTFGYKPVRHTPGYGDMLPIPSHLA